MSETDGFIGRRYEIIAYVFSEEPVYYEEFGDDAWGAWLLAAKRESEFRFYRGELGLCGCGIADCPDADAFDRAFGEMIPSGPPWSRTQSLHLPNPLVVTRPQAERFVHRSGFRPFAIVSVETMRTLCSRRGLADVFTSSCERDYPPVSPGPLYVLEKDLPNGPDGNAIPRLDSLPSPEVAAADVMVAVKLEMGWPVVLEDILDAQNQELRARALTIFGKERLLSQADVEVVHSDGDSKLLRVRDMLFVQVTDPSTTRSHVLRVPPRMQTVKQAVAWTFGFENPEDYRPLKET